MATAKVSPDPDKEKVLEILRAAKRGPKDPDVDLAKMLSEFERSQGAIDAQDILKRLVRDVGRD